MLFHRMLPRACLCAAAALSAAAIAAALVPAGGVRADLEVTMPPGTPADWQRELPERLPRYRQALVERKKEEEKEEEKKGGTVVREKEKITTEVQTKPELASGDHRAKTFSGVITDDLPFHVKWTTRTGELVPRSYPPTITDDIYWLAQAAYLRRLLHPSLAPEAETFWYLVVLGDSAREISGAAKGERYLGPLATAVESFIPKPAGAPPDAPAPNPGDTSEQKMVLRLARDELMNGDPYSLDPAYAARLTSLGDLGFDALLACAAGEHNILRRNAIALLGNYRQPQAREALLKAFREDRDPTVRTRALFHLIARRETDIVPDLLRALEGPGDGENKRLRPIAAYGLGAVAGDLKEKVAAALCEAIEKNPDDWDVIVAATIAIPRAAAGSRAAEKASLPAVKKLEASLRGPKPRFREERFGDPPAPDRPDTPEVKNRMLLELATVALARLGDGEGVARLRKLVAGEYDAAKNPVGHAKASGPTRAEECKVFTTVCPTTHRTLVEAWGEMGPEGAANLRQVIDFPKTNEPLRALALRQPPLLKDKGYISGVAVGSDSPAVRSVAMRLLYNVDERAGVRVAESVLAAFSSGRQLGPKSPKGDVTVVTALEILFRAKKLKVASLKAALPRAISEWEYVKPEVSAEGVKPFKFSPPILETICWMLGATQDDGAVPLLKRVAGDPKLPARTEAVLALGRIDDGAAVAALVSLLDDDDGWVRYNAFLALRSATGKDEFADWVYGSKGDRRAAVAAYRELLKKK